MSGLGKLFSRLDKILVIFFKEYFIILDDYFLKKISYNFVCAIK